MVKIFLIGGIRKYYEDTSSSYIIFSWGNNTSSDIRIIDECTRKR